jgi:DNA repair protein RadA/Sms
MICIRCGCKFDDSKRQCPKCLKWQPSAAVTLPGLTKLLSETDDQIIKRLATGPWDLCFGPANKRDPNGIVVTSVTLIGGLAGAGKSTLSLQLSDRICALTKREVLYIASEEAVVEVRMRADRIGIKNKHLIRGLSTLTGSEALSQLDSILNTHKPCAIIVDSLPGLTGEDHNGAVELCKLLKAYSTKLEAPSLVIDHVTKTDDFAGLYKLQHAVDTTMTLYPNEEDTEGGNPRTLQTLKNRFGQAFVSIELEMTEREGLRVFEGTEETEDD